MMELMQRGIERRDMVLRGEQKKKTFFLRWTGRIEEEENGRPEVMFELRANLGVPSTEILFLSEWKWAQSIECEMRLMIVFTAIANELAWKASYTPLLCKSKFVRCERLIDARLLTTNGKQ